MCLHPFIGIADWLHEPLVRSRQLAPRCKYSRYHHPIDYTALATYSTFLAVDWEPATSQLRYYIIRKQYHDSLLLDHCTKHDTLAPV